MAARPRSVGINWQFLARLAGIAAIIGAVALVLPALQCMFGVLQGAELPTVFSENADLDAVRVIGANDGYLARFFGTTKACVLARPPMAAPLWQQLLFGLGLLFLALFKFLGRIEYQRRVRASAKRSRQARATVQREREARHTGRSGGHPTVRERGQTSSNRAHVVPRSPSGPHVSAPYEALSEDPLALLDAKFGQRSSGASPRVDSAPFVTPAAARTPTGRTTEQTGQAPTIPPRGDFSDIASGRVGGVRIVEPVRLGESIRILFESTDTTQDPHAVKVTLAVETRTGDLAPVWSIDRTLGTAGRVSTTDAGLELEIPWREVGPTVESVARREGDAAVRIRASITMGDSTTRADAALADQLAVDFIDQHGAPLEPRTAIIRTGSGRAVRGWIGARIPGRLEIDDVEPGLCAIELENGAYLGHPGGALHRELHLTSNGIAFGGQPDARHMVTTVVSAVVYVSTKASGTTPDGSRSAPHPTIRAALDHIRAQRAAGDETYSSAEIRVDPCTRLPTARHGLAAPPESSEWVRWWSGAPADVKCPWCVNERADRLRAAARPRDTPTVAEDIHLVGMQDVRIVNSGYAAAYERLAGSPGRDVDLAAELGSIPVVLWTAPPAGPSAAFRVDIEGCSRIHFEGIHFLGDVAQSGVAVRESSLITLRRCWIDLFASGPLPRGNVHGTGRGVQIDNSGGRSEATAVVLDMCDIGWNRAERKAVPVRGAGIAVFESVTVVSRCHVHHNVSTAAPADVVVQGNSTIRGHDNFRDANRVLTG